MIDTSENAMEETYKIAEVKDYVELMNKMKKSANISQYIEFIDFVKKNFDIKIKNQTEKLLSMANSCFSAFGHTMNLVHDAEMSAIALYLQKNADAFVVDEKTTRLLIENPRKLHHILRHNLHAKVEINSSSMRDFQKLAKNVRMIRSVELVTIAYEKGLLDKYLPHIDNSRKELLESVLWGVKLNGSAVSKKEIEQILRMEA